MVLLGQATSLWHNTPAGSLAKRAPCTHPCTCVQLLCSPGMKYCSLAAGEKKKHQPSEHTDTRLGQGWGQLCCRMPVTGLGTALT